MATGGPLLKKWNGLHPIRYRRADLTRTNLNGLITQHVHRFLASKQPVVDRGNGVDNPAVLLSVGLSHQNNEEYCYITCGSYFLETEVSTPLNLIFCTF